MCRRDLMLCAVAGIFASAAVVLIGPAPDAVVDAFDVGQGDAILVRSGRDEVLIDAGPDGTVLSRLGRAMPLFDRRIEYAVLTHPHLDHYGGMGDVLDRYAIGRMLAAEHPRANGRYRTLRARAMASGTEVFDPRRGFAFASGALTFTVLRPLRDVPLPSDENASSLVIRMDIRGRPAALFMGDAPSAVEADMASSADALHVPLLKVGHHGSAGSSSDRFLAVVRPDVAVISVGRNSYGHPSPAAIERLGKAAAAVLRTDGGGVRVVFTQGTMRILRPGILWWREVARLPPRSEDRKLKTEALSRFPRSRSRSAP